MRAGIVFSFALAHIFAFANAENVESHGREPRSTSGSAFDFSKHPTSAKTPVLEGRTVTMECETTSHSSIHWTLNGEPIANKTRMHFVSSEWSSTLTITRVLRGDSGKFGCFATNTNGHSIRSQETDLDVTWLDYPAVELEQPENSNKIVKDASLQLSCEADIGTGEIQYHWFRNSERLYPKMQRVNIKKKNLFIEHVNAQDNGVYRCSVHFDGETKESKTKFTLNIKDDTVPYSLIQPSDILLPPKLLAVFDCKYENADIIEWFKNDMDIPLEANERITIYKNGSLSIKNVTKRDEGFYSCVAFKNNEKKQLQKFSARLKIAYIKSLTIMDFEPQVKENRVIIAQEAQNFAIVCLGSKDNVPSSQIMWKNNLRHLISDSGETRVEDGTLIIDVVKKSHQGVYTCISENIAGSQEIALYLAVNPTPKVTISPEEITIDENQLAFLKCDVTIEKLKNIYAELKAFWNKIITLSYLKMINGKLHSSKKHHNDHIEKNVTQKDHNTLEFEHGGNFQFSKETLLEKWLNEFNWDFYDLKWEKDSEKIIKHQDRIVITPRDGTLKIEHANASDRGVYYCEAVTSAGVSVKSKPSILNIKEKLKFSPSPVNKKLELHSAAKIHCKVKGTPTPNITWFRDYNDTLPDDVQSMNGTILFTEVSRGHKGNYSCIAENSIERIESHIFIDVVVSPRFTFPSPSQIIDVKEGDPVWIDCIAVGDPEPKTQWDRNSNIITTVNDNKSNPEIGDAINRGSGIDENERIILLDNGTLYIKSTRIEDSDHYGCTAGNSAGLKREEVILVVHNNVINPDDNEDGMITKAILITMSVVGAYMVLVIGLMVWCRIRRKRKLARNLANEKLESGDVELKEKDGPNDKLIQNNDYIINTDNNEYLQLKNAKNKCNGSINSKSKNGGILKKSKGSVENGGNTTGGESGQNMSDNSEISAHSKTSKKGFSSGNSRYDKISIPRSLLYDIVHLGRGEFGDILLAKYKSQKSNRNSKIDELENLGSDNDISNIDSQISEKPYKFVMIKSLLHTKDESHLAEFKRELDMFSKLKHENIAEVIGLCNEMEPHYLVFEHTDWGDLKQFLLATRTQEEISIHGEKGGKNGEIIIKSESATPLLLPQILTLAHQISRGMEFISDNRMVHRDLATRNCIISSKFIAKISIPALTKDLYSKEYYKHVNQVIPLRWLPYECVYESDFTSKSDVYMFACTVWEIFFKAELPFIKMSDSTVLSHLKNNTLKWKVHDNMPEDLVKLLELCWDTSLKNRPTFTDVTRTVAKILKEYTSS